MVRRSTWVLLVIFIILVGSVLFWQRSQSSQSSEVAESSVSDNLIYTNGKTIIGFRISIQGGENSTGGISSGQVIEIRSEEGGPWTLIEPSGEIVDQERVESVISNIEGMRLLSKVETDLDKKVIGLEPPAYKLEIFLENGEVQIAYIGSKTPIQGGYYANVEGESLVVVNGYNIENILDILHDLPKLNASTPSPNP